MLFNSLEFLFFFPIVLALYFTLPIRFRWVLLLIASYYFYMCWNYKYIILIVTSTVIDYAAGIQIHKSTTKWRRKFFLIASLTTNLGLLFFFKYFNFFGDSINILFSKFNIFYEVPSYHYLLPVGISFYTFQTLSYTIDVYKGIKKPERHFGIFALYVSYFPQLVAGPIERSTQLLPQFHQKITFNYERIKNGMLMMLWGFFKKVVIADRLAEYVNIVYNNPQIHEGFQNILGTIFFAFQIYCDFSGYSDIAIGSSMILGITLMRNFNRPYLAQNIREFWQRWHISLSTWFRDYFYIPLGGNRVAKWRWQYNIFLTFLVSGLWHGANWTFVIWGALHGFYQIFAIWTKKIRGRINTILFPDSLNGLHKVIQIIITVFLAWFAWIFFRANSLSDALLIIKKMAIINKGVTLNLFQFKADFAIAIACIVLLMIIEIFEERLALLSQLKQTAKIWKWLVVILLLFGITVLGKWQEVDFLYFQF